MQDRKLTAGIRTSLEELLLTEFVRNVKMFSTLESALPYLQGPDTSPNQEVEKLCQFYLPYILE